MLRKASRLRLEEDPFVNLTLHLLLQADQYFRPFFSPMADRREKQRTVYGDLGCSAIDTRLRLLVLNPTPVSEMQTTHCVRIGRYRGDR